MRVLPLAFYGLRMEGPQLISLVEEVSSLTHRHRRSIFACIFYVKFCDSSGGGRLERRSAGSDDRVYEKILLGNLRGGAGAF